MKVVVICGCVVLMIYVVEGESEFSKVIFYYEIQLQYIKYNLIKKK